MRKAAPTLTAAAFDLAAAHPHVARARTLLHENDAVTIADMRAIVRIPAPSHDEHERAVWMRDRLAGLGLEAVALDEVGNVVGWLRGGSRERAPVVIAAHLDTVFPRSTPLDLREDGGRIAAPGIADNARGLAALVAIARVMTQAAVRPSHPIAFIASVGEEGIGDLRGVKHLFREDSPLRSAAAFIALDGTGLTRVVHRAVGSRRLRITASGPGGHSWADRGVPNPIHALGEAIARLTRLTPTPSDAIALAVGRMGGGTSVNAIPQDAWIEVDLRAENGAELEQIERRARAVITDVIEAVNAMRRAGSGLLRGQVTVIGDRPSGATPVGAPLVRAARAATRMFGERVELVASSTDANVPIALGIPAIALGAGGESGRSHTLQEWYSNVRGPEGIERTLLTLLGVAGLDPGA